MSSGKLDLPTFERIVAPHFQTGGKLDSPVVQDTPAPEGMQKPASKILGTPTEQNLHVTRQQRTCVAILAPFASEDKSLAARYERYVGYCMKDSLKRTEAPYSTTAIYQFLNPSIQVERDIGLQCVLNWMARAQLVAIYIDYDITPAMQECIDIAKRRNLKLEYRAIGKIA